MKLLSADVHAHVENGKVKVKYLCRFLDDEGYERVKSVDADKPVNNIADDILGDIGIILVALKSVNMELPQERTGETIKFLNVTINTYQQVKNE